MKLPFGKYKGQTVAKVAEHSPEYIVWLYDNSTNLSDDLMTELAKIYRDCSERANLEEEHYATQRDELGDRYDY